MENDGSATRAYQSQSFDILNRSIQSSTERQSVALDDEAQEYEKRLTERGDEDILVSGAERYERKIHPVRSRVRKFLRRFGATLCKLTILICAIGLAVDTVRLVADTVDGALDSAARSCSYLRQSVRGLQFPPAEKNSILCFKRASDRVRASLYVSCEFFARYVLLGMDSRTSAYAVPLCVDPRNVLDSVPGRACRNRSYLLL